VTQKWAEWLENLIQFLVEGVEIFIFVTLFLLVVVSYHMSMLPGAYSKG
jgi:Na+-transporting methylmalonyl-CoA/oxaloacetate decarboxylase gamma subunit